MGAKKKPLDTRRRRRRRHRRRARSATTARRSSAATSTRRPQKEPAADHRGRGHQRDGREDRRLARREEADLDGRHPGLRPPLRGRVQQELARRRLRGRRRSPARLGGEGHAVVVGEGVTDDLAGLARRLRRDEGAPRRGRPRASRSRSSTRWPRSSTTTATTTRCSAAACSASRSAPAWPRAWAPASTMEVTAVHVEDGKLVAERPILGDSPISESRYSGGKGIIIGRLNAFELARVRRRRGGGRGRRRRALAAGRPGARWSSAASSAAPTSNIEDADVLVAGGRGLGKAEGFQLCEDLAERVRRHGRRRDPRGGRRRLVPVRRPDRPDGQDRRAEALPRGGHLRRDPAQGRHAELGEHRRDQQGLERADLRVLRPRASSATSTRSCRS